MQTRLIRACGVPEPTRNKVYPILKERLIQLLAEGKIYQAEAEKIADVTWGTVRDWMKVRGIDVHKARAEYLKGLLDE